ncbi:LysR family transcriptional regulator [Demequina sp. TTPB684]|uniref:LysR family transcriptional regulator n=1 Tax=unclassified Demequina TaxID=2620311 RepID=UPI001CF16BDA|nr:MULTISPECIES: LysR family transcriptional regulator [unclassified Demequina]MCB2413794.1 LysR family transcriptional regulator [Demequina sp. TTPB684]UPU89298.1 LysR family transcriptional regulator [Demequina sp. TMPB413]
MLELNGLAMLREFAARGTLAATASAMGYSASAVSQQLAALEREAGVALTVRSGRRLRLTPAGERLVVHADAVLARLEEAQVDLRQHHHALRGTVKLAVFQSAALALVPPALRSLATTHPELRVMVTQSEPGAALADTWARDFDVVVAEEYPHHSAPHYPEVDRRPLVVDEIRLCVGGPWADATTLPAVSDATWVMEPKGTATRHFAEQACRTAGFEPDVRFETADLQAHVRFIESGLAVGLLPGLMWGRGDLTAFARPLDPPAHRTVFTATRRSSRHDAAIGAVIAALERAAQDLKTLAGTSPLSDL